MADEKVRIGGSGNSRVLRQRGSEGAVADETIVIGDVVDLLGDLLLEARKQTRLLAIIADEEIEDGDQED